MPATLPKVGFIKHPATIISDTDRARETNYSPGDKMLAQVGTVQNFQIITFGGVYVLLAL